MQYKELSLLLNDALFNNTPSIETLFSNKAPCNCVWTKKKTHKLYVFFILSFYVTKKRSFNTLSYPP